MSDTDLITAGGSSDDVELSNPVNSPILEAVSAAPVEPAAAPTADAPTGAVSASGDRPTSLTAMVLPDLRALAGQLGVKGSSGMRKSELIAAIREHRGETNGAATPQAAATTTGTSDQAAPVNGTARDVAEKAAPPRRERRGASRGAGAVTDAKASDQQVAPEKAPEDKAPESKVSATVDAPEKTDRADKGGNQKKDTAQSDAPKNDRQNKGNDAGGNNGNSNNGGRNANNNGGNGNNGNGNNANNNNANNNNPNNDDDDDGDGRQGRRGRRFRDRRRRGERGDAQGGGGNNDRDARTA